MGSTVMKTHEVIRLEESLAQAKAYLKDIEAKDYHGSSDEMKEIMAAEHSMCSADIWVLEEMIDDAKKRMQARG